MDELQANLEWKEAARWLKFEEDVDDAGRWSKPHVATLSLHSLLELRNCLTKGAVYLEFKGEDMVSIVEELLDNVVNDGFLDESKRESVKNALLLKHIHQHEKEFQNSLNNGEKKSLFSKKPSSQNINETNGNNSGTNLHASENKDSSNALTAKNVDNLNKSSFDSAINLSANNIKKIDSKPKLNQNFMKKIPAGAEASNVLVGEVDFLEHHLTAFIRLKKSCLLGDLTEVPVPTRFLFIILGPKGNIHKYHEIGRSISTLMSDEIFHDVAYTAKSNNDLLKAFDEFLDQVTVLPPGEWDPNIRLDPPTKVPTHEERIEQIETKLNGNLNKSDEDIHPHEVDPGLEFTGRFCGGLIDDIKRKTPWILSDLKDAFNFQCLSSILFMYFACLSPIITFGGLLGTATDQNMSAIESLIAGAISGILYGLFSGQPMTILGSTGPVLVFETILNNFCKQFDIDYIGFRAWIGLWTAFILIIIVVTDCSALVKYITRFTEESFASLIAIIFIKESIFKLIDIKKKNQVSNDPLDYHKDYAENLNCLRCVQIGVDGNYSTNLTGLEFLNENQCNQLGENYRFLNDCKYVPDVFYFSIFLYIFTFSFAMILKTFRTSRFFPSAIRYKVSDFGIVIVIASAVTLDYFCGYNTPKLNVPLKFETTIPSRGWLINPITRNPGQWWLFFLAIAPALLATILIFMDQHITAVIVNRKENKLKKGGGYHLDLLIVSIAIGINSIMGLPWMVAATVLSINHVLSLKKESPSAAPGEKPKFLGVIEQRVTNVAVFVLIGCSIFLSNLLRMIPMPVLYGVFLYMGISSLNGIQFMHRIILIFMPEKHQPDYIFLRHVRTFKVHIFTAIQIASILLLFIIKSNKKISILFPIMVLALVAIRKFMDYIFTQKELSYLDDIMPEIVKRSIDDKYDDENKKEIQLQDITSRVKNNDDTINISNELSKTNIWQDLVKSEDNMRSQKKKLNLNLPKRTSQKSRTKSGTSTQSNEIHAVETPLLNRQDTSGNKSPQVPSIVINK